jgi:hypothetical protein
MSQYAECRNSYYEKLSSLALAGLKRSNFAGHYVPDRQAARDLVLSLIPDNASIGFGDSVTVEEIGVVPLLRERGNLLYERYRKGITGPVPDDEKNKYLAFTADAFLTGVNAVTTKGQLVFVDGKGTRAGPVVFGPKRVVIVAGVNKIVRTVEEGLQRVKRIAAPLNARRHHHDSLPCAHGAECQDCLGQERMCCATVVLEHGYHQFPGRVQVILVGESLGF